jgi:hypothetical protein
MKKIIEISGYIERNEKKYDSWECIAVLYDDNHFEGCLTNNKSPELMMGKLEDNEAIITINNDLDNNIINCTGREINDLIDGATYVVNEEYDIHNEIENNDRKIINVRFMLDNLCYEELYQKIIENIEQVVGNCMSYFSILSKRNVSKSFKSVKKYQKQYF